MNLPNESKNGAASGLRINGGKSVLAYSLFFSSLSTISSASDTGLPEWVKVLQEQAREHGFTWFAGIVALVLAVAYVGHLIHGVEVAAKGAKHALNWLLNGLLFVRGALSLSPETRRRTGEQTRLPLRHALSDNLIITSAKALTFLRSALLLAVSWRWCRIHFWDKGIKLRDDSWFPYMSWSLLGCSVAYIIFATAWYRRALRCQRRATESQSITIEPLKPIVWRRHFPDIFFWPALVDLAYVTVVSVCIPTAVNEVHLGYLVAFFSVWLFRSAGFGFAIWAISLLATLLAWWWTSLVSAQDINPIYVLFTTHLPRSAFWFVVVLAMIIMRIMRRSWEDNLAFFRTLAEAMPFDVILKDRDRKVVYANQRCLAKLAANRRKVKLTLKEVYGKSDEELGVDPEKAKEYERIDLEIISGKRDHFCEFEQNYANNTTTKIETTKVPLCMKEPDGSISVKFIPLYLSRSRQ